jgi:uncharacterized protein
MHLGILTLVLILSMVLIVLGLPGLWLMIATAITYNLIVPGRPISWLTIALICILGVGAEVLDLTLTGRYAKKYGGSRRAGIGAIIGGIIGGMVGLPIPLFGPVIGALVGSFAGALVAEYREGRDAVAASRVATGALLGRVAGTVVKVGLGFAIAIWIFIAALH